MDYKDLLLLEFLSTQTDYFEFKEDKMPDILKGEFLFDLKSADSIAVRIFELDKYGLINKRNNFSAKITEAGRQKVNKEVEKRSVYEQKENLEMQKLKGEVEDITQRLVDYQSVKKKSNRADIVSILTAIATAVMIVIELIKLRNG